jgi:hypothetical protein
VHTVGSNRPRYRREESMPRKQYDYLPTDLRCIDNGHTFRAKVRKKLHYVDGYDLPVFSTVPKGALNNVRCTECGSLVEEAK